MAKSARQHNSWVFKYAVRKAANLAILCATAFFADCTGAEGGRENVQGYLKEKLQPRDLKLSTNSLNLTVGTAGPTVTGSVANEVTSCEATPALPSGLVIHQSNCSISGTASVAQSTTVHSIRAHNEHGFASADLSVTATYLAPTINFAASYEREIIGNITAISPTISGHITSCIANPTLPAGLAINQTTCQITGTTTAVSGPTNYVITAANANFNTQATIALSFGKVTYTWATATDNGNGRVTYVIASPSPSGYSAGSTFTLAKCSVGQTWQAGTNSCTGSALTYSFTNALTQCTNAGGSLASKYHMQLIIHCTDRTYPAAEYGNCGAGNFVNPAVNVLFPGTQSATYWTSTMAREQVCGSWCQLQDKGYYYVDYSSSGMWRDQNTTTSFRYVRCRF